MPTREPPQTRGCRGDLQIRPPGPGPPRLQRLVPRGLETYPLCQPQPGPHTARPRKIVFEDELPSRPLLGAKKPVVSIPGGHMPMPHSVPDYELKYPAVSSKRERSRYAAVFQDQYAEFLELQQEVGSARAKLQRLEALLTSLPPPRSQKEAQVATRVWRKFEKKRTVSHGLLSPTAWSLHSQHSYECPVSRKENRGSERKSKGWSSSRAIGQTATRTSLALALPRTPASWISRLAAAT
ncbi:occludin/ELL domain-containing protein 1 isoform X1 [Pteropus vampyrus]|uniref:Occludin/ELL domain-containing protein 1 isoform X1 n=1 Tax=Pteropus vampyrus TaxID=132908 RepID=A0A6P3QLA3_PTEVA|nr:occludin/ELL domain-containing protein 1 isoform X1 [Pteropus vampyrus]